MADPEDVRDPESSGDPAADDSAQGLDTLKGELRAELAELATVRDAVTAALPELREQMTDLSNTVADLVGDVEQLTTTVAKHSADLGFIGGPDLDDGLPYECIGRLPAGTLFVIDSAQFEVIGISASFGGQLKVMTPGGDRHYMNPAIEPDSVEWTPEVEGWDHLHRHRAADDDDADAGDDADAVVAESQPAS